MYYIATYDSPVGLITLASTADNLIGLWEEGQKYFGSSISGKAVEKRDTTILIKTKYWLDRYFAGEKPGCHELPLAPIGSDFRQEVWHILREIPYGKVITYGDIAKKMAMKMKRQSMSSQAVGGAVGHNPISLIIPCHRVVGTNGSLVGFGGGINRKIQLLELEGVNMARLSLPQKRYCIMM